MFFGERYTQCAKSWETSIGPCQGLWLGSIPRCCGVVLSIILGVCGVQNTWILGDSSLRHWGTWVLGDSSLRHWGKRALTTPSWTADGAFCIRSVLLLRQLLRRWCACRSACAVGNFPASLYSIAVLLVPVADHVQIDRQWNASVC